MNTVALAAYVAVNAGLSDAQIVTALRATEEVWVDVSVAALEGACRTAGIISRLEDLIAANDAPGLPRTAAKELVGLIGGKLASLEMSNPTKRAAILAMLGALEAVEWITAEEEAMIRALARATRTIAAGIDCPEIEAMDDASAALTVAAARAG